MTGRPLPADIIERFGHLPDAQHRTGNEFSSACPKCGGGRGGHDPSDRFRFWQHDGRASNFWCRRCGYQGFADDDKPGTEMTPERIKELDEIREREAAREERRLQAKIQELRQAAYWQGWHDAMQERHRQMWRDQGIADSLQDWFKLGYVERHGYGHNGKLYDSPAMTIPVFDVGWQVVNVQYRLMQPVDGAGKYRFTADLPAPLYLTDPDEKPSGATLLVEGAKKAIVLFAHLGHKYKVVAVPSKMPSGQLIDQLKECEPVYVALDPDAYVARRNAKGQLLKPAVNRIVKMLGSRARIVKLPCKPDDMIVQYGAGSDDVEAYLRLARMA